MGKQKTYFWENVLKNEIENIEVDGHKLKTNYVSLYGITSIDEIIKRIVLDNLLK
jgi:CTP:phosphocholine cytidylyltransferase-like protein